MSAATDSPGTAGGARRAEPRPRIFLIWLPAAVIADLLIWFVWAPHLPPGVMASAASVQQFTIKVLAVMAAPVMIFVLVYFGYALIVWRQREGDEEDGPPLHGNTRVSGHLDHRHHGHRAVPVRLRHRSPDRRQTGRAAARGHSRSGGQAASRCRCR